MHRSTFHILVASVLLLALALAVPAQPDKLNLDALDIGNEARSLNAANDHLASFFAEAAKLSKKDTISTAEFAAIERSAGVAKGDTAKIIAILIGLVNKLKASNHWNQQFDDQFAATLSRANAKNGLQQAGGARKLFEAAASEAGGLSANIDDELQSLRAKVARAKESHDSFASNHVRLKSGGSGETLTAQPFAAGGGFKCKALLVGLAIAEVAGADRTACRLDELYGEKGCGAKKKCGAATQ